MLMALQPSKGAVYKQLANGHVVFSLKSFLFTICSFVILFQLYVKKLDVEVKLAV